MPGGHQEKVMKTGHLEISEGLSTGLKLLGVMWKKEYTYIYPLRIIT